MGYSVDSGGGVSDGNGIYGGSDSIPGDVTVDIDGNTLAFNNGDFIIESVGAASYLAVVGDQIIMGSTNDTIVDIGRFVLGGDSSSTVQQELVFADKGATPFEGTLTNADLSVDRTWTLPDESGEVLIALPGGSISDPAGGIIVDAEARAAIVAIIDFLES